MSGLMCTIATAVRTAADPTRLRNHFSVRTNVQISIAASSSGYLGSSTQNSFPSGSCMTQ